MAGGYGASNRDLAKGIKNDNERAAYIARQSLVDYQALGSYGNTLRRYFIPFWAWREGQFRRYANLFRNIWADSAEVWKAEGAGKGAKKAIPAATLAATFGARLAVKMLFYTSMIQIVNESVRHATDCPDVPLGTRPVMLVGCDADTGDAITVKMPGAFREYFDAIGLQDVATAYQAWQAGRGGALEAVSAVGMALVNNLAAGFSPVKVGLEYVANQSYYPDVFAPRPIRDMTEHLLKTIRLDLPYKVFNDRPVMGSSDSWFWTFLNLASVGSVAKPQSLGERSWAAIRAKQYAFLESNDLPPFAGGQITPFQNAVYYWRLAKRRGNPGQEAKYLAVAQEAWKEEALKGARKSDFGSALSNALKSYHPLGPLMDNKLMLDRFLDSLTPEEEAMKDLSLKWYAGFVAN